MGLSNGNYRSLHFLSPTWGFRGGYQGLERTVNGGDDWTPVITSGYSRGVFAIDMPIPAIGFANDDNGRLLSSSGGLSNWLPISNITGERPRYINDLDCVDAQTGWLVGAAYGPGEPTQAQISKTTSGGKSWIKQRITSSNRLNSVLFVDKNEGWAVGEAGEIFHTTSGGDQWAHQAPIVASSLYGLQFTADTGYAVGAAGTIIKYQRLA